MQCVYDSPELAGADAVIGKYAVQIAISQVSVHEFAKHVSEICGKCKMAGFVQLLARKTRPRAVDPASTNIPSFLLSISGLAHLRLHWIIRKPVVLLTSSKLGEPFGRRVY